ncbi:MAG: hypothetical protein ACLTBV_31625 [Enterocloster bolteae]
MTGITSQCQMPYTFTRGRGELSTDWYGIIGALAMCGFKGAVVYDIAGLFEVSPARLRPGWYRPSVCCGLGMGKGFWNWRSI